MTALAGGRRRVGRMTRLLDRWKYRRLPIEVHCTPECGWSALVPNDGHSYDRALDHHHWRQHEGGIAMEESDHA